MDNINYKDGKKNVSRIKTKGELMGRCATFNRKYMCCSVHVLSSVQNCPFECSYCFLQNYLTDGSTKVVTDIDTIMNKIKEKISSQPERLFRIGTWELGDSLALEHETGQAGKLIHEFSRLNNAVLELKTKSDCVESILGLDHNGRTVVSWSLNSSHIIKTDEQRTASQDERVEAIRKTAGAGYLIGLHFDPMIYHDKWRENYTVLIKKVFDAVDHDRIAWISIGSLRFNPEMKKKIENNYPESRLTCAEMVLGDDAKMRYVKPLRLDMYRHLYYELKKHISDKNLIYLCMERWDVWDRIFGSHPDSIEHLDYLFAASLYNRYGLGPCKPCKDKYGAIGDR